MNAQDKPANSAKADPPRDNHGYLNRCPKAHERSPDMSGQAWVAGKCYELVAWVNISKRGKKYLNLKFSPSPSDAG